MDSISFATVLKMDSISFATVLIGIILISLLGIYLIGLLVEYIQKKKRDAIQPEPIDTSMDGQWLQLRNPVSQLKYKNDNTGGLLMKNGNYVIEKRFCFKMYIKFTSPTEYDTIEVELYPKKKLLYSTWDIYYERSESELKRRLLEKYEVVTNKKIINKLDCVVKNHYKSIEKEKENRNKDIIKAVLSHRCK